ncbi:MAG TPA: SAM-dependent chlorinase/fluorinase [Chloroflexia bacterium]|nr:SAM-dependent chlorinase/fluorinase [Chloroflexia bacterium]
MSLNVYRGLLAGLEDRLQRSERPPVITITTDFGLHDGYVGAVKGVILALLPDAMIVDISHDIGPQQIHEGAFILYRAYRYFPASSVHIAVVDPGVGTSRRPIVLATRHGTFVGPDNGIFTYVLRAEQEPVRSPEGTERPVWVGGMWGIAPEWASDGQDGELASEPASAAIPNQDGLPRAYHLVNPHYWLESVSTTFHGRDIFAPVAAHLASGAQPDRMGELVDLKNMAKLPVGVPRVRKSSRATTVLGQIVYLDRFGNIITNLPDRLLMPLLEESSGQGQALPVIEVGDHKISGLATAYGDVREGQPLALIGSERLLEIAVRNASAAQRLKARIGDTVRVTVSK